jgi:hypothetical protein
VVRGADDIGRVIPRRWFYQDPHMLTLIVCACFNTV